MDEVTSINEKRSTYRYLLLVMIICFVSYILLNIIWHVSSQSYRPTSPLYDVRKEHEEINLLWDVYRKGRTSK